MVDAGARSYHGQPLRDRQVAWRALGPDLRFAHELADAADAITLTRFRAPDLGVETKPDLTPVSEADRAAEEAVRALVADRRPGEGVFGEELGDNSAMVRWIVDPIDGTRNYVRGVPVWATLLALERDGVVEVGLVSAPALARRWWAARGEGAWSNGERCRVSAVAQIEDAFVSTTSSRDMPPGWNDLTRRGWAVRGFGDFWQHCLVADGAVDAATDETLELWDYAAVQLIVEEAGGRCTTFNGDPPSPGASFLSTNGLVHDEVVALLGGL
jgi:histidinol-phosphatase